MTANSRATPASPPRSMATISGRKRRRPYGESPMSSGHLPLRRLTAAAALLGVLAGCEQKALVSIPRTAVNHTLFASYVAIGNSITAGYQSGGILDTTQVES